MRLRICCHLVVVVILFYSRGLFSEIRNEDHETFCLFTKSTLGHTQCSFLQRSAATASMLFYWSIWTTDQRVEQCSISAEADLIQNYLTLCHDKRALASNKTQSLPLNISLLLEPDSLCQFQPSTTNIMGYKMNLDPTHQVGAKIRQKRSWIIVPGTLWCGQGSSAGNYEQLGMFEHVDRCCREHDHCRHVVRPFTVNFGIFNPSFFTISHCNCDHRFKQCLQKVNDTVSNMVGYTFFNILKLRCFDLIQKRGCTQLNWFGMCTSIQDAPFAVLKNPIPYNLSTSNLEKSLISDPPGYQMQPTANENANSIKPKPKPKSKPASNHQDRRKLSKTRKNNPVALARGDAFLLRKNIQHRYVKTKKSPRTTVLPPLRKVTTQANSLIIHNSTVLYQKNQAKIKPRTLSIHKKELMNQIPLSPGPERIMCIHTTVSQNQMVTPLIKKILTNKGRTTSQSQNATMKIKMIQSLNPAKSKKKFDNVVSPMEYNFQCKVGNASKLTPQKMFYQLLDRLFARMKERFVNKTQPNKKGTFLCKTNTLNKNMESTKLQSQANLDLITSVLTSPMTNSHAKQKIKGSPLLNIVTSTEINNKSINVTNATKNRNASPATLLPNTKPRSTLWRKILLPTTTLSVNTSVINSWESIRFKNHSSTKQENISSAIEKEEMSKPSNNSSKVDKAFKSMITSTSMVEKQTSANQKVTSVSKQKRVSKTTETPRSSL